MTLKLYHCHQARSMRVVWTLEEMGLDYDVTVMQFPPRVFHKDYKEINPLGTVPYLIDDAVEPAVTMSESAAICQYLVARYGPTDLRVTPDEPDYGAWLNWLYRADTTFTFPQTIYFRYTRLEPEERRNPQVAEDYKAWFLGRWRAVDRALDDGRQWLCGGRFTVADICVGWSLLFATILNIDEAVTDNVRPWWERLQARDAYQRAKSI